MIKSKSKNVVVAALIAVFALFVSLGLGFARTTAKAEDTVKEEVEITKVSGAWQTTGGGRYLIWLNENENLWSKLSGNPEMSVDINGTTKPVETSYSKGDLAIIVYEAEVPKAGKSTITIKAGTDVGGVYTIKKDAVIETNNGSFSLKVVKSQSDITFAFNPDSASQDFLSRYCIYVDTEAESLTTKTRGDFTCVVDEGTDNEKTVSAGYWVSENGDTTMLLLVDYENIIDGATASTEIGKHSLTFKQGSVLNGGDTLEYKLAEDYTVWVGNETVYETEDEIPDLPVGYVKATKGTDKKTIDINTVKIEDFVAAAPVVKLKAGAEKDANGNVKFTSGDPSTVGYCQSIKISGKNAEPQVEFRSEYVGGDVYLALELRSVYDNGNYWLTDGAPTVRLRYAGNKAADAEQSECLWFDFFYNGLQGSPSIISYSNDEFTFEKGEFFVKFGAVNKKDKSDNDGFVFFVQITQGTKMAYAECMMSGDYNVSEDGDVAIYQAPFKTARIDGYAPETNEVSDITVMSVDKQREIDGQLTDIGLMSFYSPQIRLAEGYDEYDVSDLVPIGNSITYTKIEGNTTDSGQSMINATNVSVKNGGYSVKMKIKFGGDDFGCTFAFRGKNTNAKSGYKLVIADDIVIIGSMSIASPFVKDTEYEIEIGCVDYFIADEKVSAGAVVYLKVNGEKLIEDNIDKLSGLGSNFCGLIEGAGGSMVTIAPAKTSEVTEMKITTTANKTVLAKGKKATLSCEANMTTAFDVIEYEVVKGKARIDGNGIFAENDYEIVVRAKITNEYGTFYGEEFVFNKGKKEVKKGCKGGIFAMGILPLAAAMTIPMILRRKKDEE